MTCDQSATNAVGLVMTVGVYNLPLSLHCQTVDELELAVAEALRKMHNEIGVTA